MQDLRVGLVPIARINYDMELATQITHAFRAQLVMRGFRVVGDVDLITTPDQASAAIDQLRSESYDLLLVFQATFADSQMLVEFAEALDKPIFLWGVPEERTGGRLRLGSLIGINLGAHALKLRGRHYEYAYARPDDVQAMKHLRSTVIAASVVDQLKTARIGIVGEHPAGMDTCHLDEQELRTRLGVQVVPIEIAQVFERMNRLSPAAVQPIRARLTARLDGLDDLDQAPLHRTLSAYQVLQEISKEMKLDGLAVRCWPEFFTEMQCSACGALALLNDQRIPCGCEADINGTITQLMLQWLSGEPAFGTDIVSADEEENWIVLWHCGQAPLSMADPQFRPKATVHSNRLLPLLMEFPLKPGPVTLARLSRAGGGLGLVLGRGQMQPASPSFSGTSGVVRFERPALQVLNSILEHGLEHHIALAYGDHYASLTILARLLNMPVLRL
jgi:L-fucose isomerase-like protein